MAEFYPLESWILYILITLSFLALLIYQSIPAFRKSYAYTYIFGIFVVLLCLCTGAIRVNSSNESMCLSASDSIMAFKGRIKSSPDEKAKSIACVLDIETVYKTEIWKKANAQVLLYLAKDSLSRSLSIGDEILVSSKLERVRNNGNPNEFDYAKYLQRRYILNSTYVRKSSWKLVTKSQTHSLKQVAAEWRQKLLSTYKKAGLKNESYEILSALTLGAREEVSEDVKSVWTAAGATHVLAVSGLHVGIIFGVMQFLLRFLSSSKLGRYIRAIILILCLWSYALLTGLSPSVMRAASMFSILALGLMINRKGTIYNSLMISACALLLYDPFVLFDVGFQFSYLAVISIVFFQPKFENLLEVNSFIPRWSWKLFTVSLAAQVGTFPLAVYYFHQFPSYFFLSNFVIIPVAGLLIYGSALLLIFSGIDFISKWLTYGLQHFVEYIHWLIYQIQALPGALIERISFSSFQVILLYALIIGLTLSFVWKKKQALYVSLVILIVFQVINISDSYQSQVSELIVFNANKQSVICIRDRHNLLVLSDTILNEKQKNRLVYPYAMANGVKNYSYQLLKENEIRLFKDKRLAILSNSALKNHILDLDIDYLILRNNAKGYDTFVEEFKDKLLIKDASNYAQKYRGDSSNTSANTWDTRLNGAFHLSLE